MASRWRKWENGWMWKGKSCWPMHGCLWSILECVSHPLCLAISRLLSPSPGFLSSLSLPVSALLLPFACFESPKIALQCVTKPKTEWKTSESRLDKRKGAAWLVCVFSGWMPGMLPNDLFTSRGVSRRLETPGDDNENYWSVLILFNAKIITTPLCRATATPKIPPVFLFFSPSAAPGGLANETATKSLQRNVFQLTKQRKNKSQQHQAQNNNKIKAVGFWVSGAEDTLKKRLLYKEF